LSKDKKTISIPNNEQAGWIIDGQHRFIGAHIADTNLLFPVIAFIGLEQEEQIQQFVTINKEAKGVPTSLYLDLLPHLKNKKPSDIARERAADIGTLLKRDESSVFFGRIVTTTSPRKGELSLTNFVRKFIPLILEGKGILSAFYEHEQRLIISNYYRGLKNAFPGYFRKYESVFFQTIGFGAVMNALPTVFSICLKKYQGFTAEDVTKIFKEILHFEFSNWSKIGTGNAAEREAGDDLISELKAAFDEGSAQGGLLRL